MEKELIPIDQAVELFGISRSTLYRWAKTGKINIYKVGWFSRIDKKELSDLLNPTIKGGEKFTANQISNSINKALEDLKERMEKGDIDYNTYVLIFKEMVVLESRLKNKS
ncbi:MAG: helix-turn-helix domain-containing protein [Bacillota bacterium]|jgi:excisionase family DNA binding protein